ncbi:MAG: DsbA family protein [Alphaproteobacteria bacterium]|nr:DsbA family protein [Alphaproteobacteria bacterium]
MNRFLLISLSLLAALSFTTTNVRAEEFTDAQKAEIKKLFDEYLAASGEQVLNSVNKYQADLEEKQRAESEVKAKEFLSTLDTSKLPMAGNPEGDVTMIEFFDFNCGYCRKALEEIQTVLKDDKKVKIVFMDMPILGPSSLEASKWALAAHKQGKYFEYHQAVLTHNGQKDDASLEKIAKDVGLDIEKLKEDKESQEISDTINGHIAQAQNLGIRGTPGFIINGQVFPGYIPAAQIEQTIAEARKK